MNGKKKYVLTLALAGLIMSADCSAMAAEKQGSAANPAVNGKTAEQAKSSGAPAKEALKPVEKVPEKTEKSPVKALKASSHPVLQWESYQDAVMYELQISLTKDFAADNIILQTTNVYTFGYQPDLSPWLGKTLFYRYRPLDYGRSPIDGWSKAAAIQPVQMENFPEFRPRITSNWSKVTPILYPVYSWIPVYGADHYKVEVYSVTGKEAGQTQNRYKLVQTYEVKNGLAFDCYDEHPRIGDYAWRVQAFTQEGAPIGQFSPMEEFTLKAVPHQFFLGIFGDSIMHGGGAVSGAPSDFNYSLHAHLKAPAVNLAKSGDTAEASLQRFDRDVAPFSPRVLIVMTGSNSLRGGEKAQKVIGELTAIYNKCKENQITPFFLTLPPINPERISLVFQEETTPQWKTEFQKVNRFIRENLPHFDVAPLFADANGLIPAAWCTDGLHPDGKAKQAMADVINRSDLIAWPDK